MHSQQSQAVRLGVGYLGAEVIQARCVSRWWLQVDEEVEEEEDEEEEEEEEGEAERAHRYSLRDRERSRLLKEDRYSPPKEEQRHREMRIFGQGGQRCDAF
jgi:hypothetical protein